MSASELAGNVKDSDVSLNASPPPPGRTLPRILSFSTLLVMPLSSTSRRTDSFQPALRGCVFGCTSRIAREGGTHPPPPLINLPINVIEAAAPPSFGGFRGIWSAAYPSCPLVPCELSSPTRIFGWRRRPRSRPRFADVTCLNLHYRIARGTRVTGNKVAIFPQIKDGTRCDAASSRGDLNAILSFGVLSDRGILRDQREQLSSTVK